MCLKAQQGLQGTLPWTCAKIKGTDSEIIFLFSFVVFFICLLFFEESNKWGNSPFSMDC